MSLPWEKKVSMTPEAALRAHSEIKNRLKKLLKDLDSIQSHFEKLSVVDNQ